MFMLRWTSRRSHIKWANRHIESTQFYEINTSIWSMSLWHLISCVYFETYLLYKLTSFVYALTHTQTLMRYIHAAALIVYYSVWFILCFVDHFLEHKSAFDNMAFCLLQFMSSFYINQHIWKGKRFERFYVSMYENYMRHKPDVFGTQNE